MWIGLEGVSKGFQGVPLFEDATFQIHKDDRVAIIGANGCGKTTLLRILAGKIPPDTGQRRTKKDITIGMIEQLPDYGNESLYEAARRSFERLHKIEKRLEEIDELLVTTKDSQKLEKLLYEQDHLLEQFERLGGYSMEAQLEKVLKGVGFSTEDFAKPVSRLSGGEKRRLAFASLLLSHPDVLLLDEPTNHLDIEAIQWTERFLSDYKGAIVVVSHDRMFLDKLAKKIIEIRGRKLHFYTGNYSFYEQEREVRYQLALKAYEAQQEEIARQEEIIRRLHANPKLNVAQSRRRKLERMERLEKPVPPPRGAKFRFQNKNPKGNLAIEAKNLTHRFGSRTLFENLTLRIEPGERVAFVGPNGAGKTTLMRILARELEPQEGEVIYGKTTTFGYFSQERTDLPLERTVLQVMQDAYPKEDRSKLQDFLALFLFGEDDWDKQVKQLSGGERSKLSLARILYSEPNLLALDEPTNHLDIPTCQNLESALQNFPGTLLFVSHDRYFINNLARRIFYLKDGQFLEVYGNYFDLEEELKKRQLTLDEEEKKGKKSSPKASKKSPKKQKKHPAQNQNRKKYKGSFQKLEEEIIQLEEQLEELEREMAKPEIYQSAGKIRELRKKYDQLKARLEELNSYWEEMV